MNKNFRENFIRRAVRAGYHRSEVKKAIAVVDSRERHPRTTWEDAVISILLRHPEDEVFIEE